MATREIILALLLSTNSANNDSCYLKTSMDYDINYDEPVEIYFKGERRFINITTIPFRRKDGGFFKLEKTAAIQFVKLAKKAKKAGFTLQVNSAFRTSKEQQALRRKLGAIAAVAGKSAHQLGLAIDLSGTTLIIPNGKINKKFYSNRYCKKVKGGVRCPTRLSWWLQSNAPLYGFFNNVPNEPWHYAFKLM